MKKSKKTNAPAEQESLASPGFPIENIRHVEISQEEKLERSLLSGLLLQQTEDLNRKQQELKKQRDQEVIELIGGGTTSLGALKALIASKRQPYEPRFPRSIPFFSEIYRLNGWHDLDPASYIKPAVVAVWINELIYNRFSQEVLPTLRVFNPKRFGGSRAYKHFQFLNAEGQAELEQYRDEAIALMQTCSTWYEFRAKLFVVHSVPYQVELFAQ
ncbi:hypothetical protein GCM10011375_40270 [Hymenobacter qilianensis]|uniref:Uncharacterized protein n=2 Tax=Hymenobacter qilianensis TaxID=1385715 RepID=A0ACB5PXW0_9BACT|nr:P63C domain-containing protein [Hymenobacter qilianensis]QNP54491.1 hypothetical protein H9L05_22285 [Hymenobacter qilianensis]GGF81256.1 hypothetical protein GCM10011375_40270 [Hymenobacter qilianensis]